MGIGQRQQDENKDDKNGKRQFGFVAVAGAPNAGKSTLVNALVGNKVSIVSPKVQTTRTRVLGIAIVENSQIVLVDTPGIFRKANRKRLEKSMIAAAFDGIGMSDIIILVVDCSKKNVIGEVETTIRLIEDREQKKIILALNKIDKIKVEKLLSLAGELNSKHEFDATFMISALKKDAIDDLGRYIAELVPEGDWHYPEDQISDMPARLMAAEITREKLFLRLHDELPYRLRVETEKWEDNPNGSVTIMQTVFTSCDAHKGIIIGKGGRMLKNIGKSARLELEDILQRRVHLKLFVKVSKSQYKPHDTD